MRSFCLSLLLCCLSIANLCLAEPIIKSDSRTFNIINGIYDLQGNVYVQLSVKNTPLIITGDAAQVYMYQQEIHGAGNITLSFDNISFTCDTVDVFAKEKTAFLEGTLKFIDQSTKITSDKGSYCWKTKLATFTGHVNINGKKTDKEVLYNIDKHRLLD